MVLIGRSGTWFDPLVVEAATTLMDEPDLWQNLQEGGARETVLALESGGSLPASPERIDSLCQAFAGVVDAKSPFTFCHSVGVSQVAIDIATGMGLDAEMITMIRRASLLHDIGKLGVSNAILDKPGKLTPEEWEAMKMHPVYTQKILELITGFEELAVVAAAHHERLDGTGYPRNMSGKDLTLPARIIAVADVYQALSEKRSYREGLPSEVVLKMIKEDIPHRLDADCFEALGSQRHSSPDSASPEDIKSRAKGAGS